MENKEKLKLYFSFNHKLKNITNYFYFKYYYSLRLEWQEIKQMVDLEFFKSYQEYIKENKIVIDKFYQYLRDRIRNQIRDLWFTNKSGKNFNTTILKIDPWSGNDFYEETEEVIERYSKELNLSEKERNFLIDWSNVNYNKKSLWNNKNNLYTRDMIDNFQKHIKNKLLRKEVI